MTRQPGSSKPSAPALRPRRFIAAAVCPGCGQADCLYYLDDTDEHVACAECDYRADKPVEVKESEQTIEIVNILDADGTAGE